jgi:hypothetical protein
MTRANFLIITKDGKFKLQGNSSCYPSNVMSPVLKFATSTASTNSGATNGFYDRPDSRELSEFIEAVGLTLGSVGNPCYYYEIDFVKQTVKVFDTKSRWINAPVDWEAKGWRGLYTGKNGKLGYMDCNVKGKCIYNKTLSQLVKGIYGGATILNKDVVEEAEAL